MTKFTVTVAVMSIALLGLAAFAGSQMMGGQGQMMQEGQRGGGMEGASPQAPGYAEPYPCPMGGYGGWGPGMMGGYGGWGMGHGMMHGMMHGYGMGPGMMGGYGGYGMGPGMMGGYGGYGDYGMGPGMMRGWGYGGPETKKFLDETRQTRREMMLKQFDYADALADPDTDREKLKKLGTEIWELKKQIYEKARETWK